MKKWMPTIMCFLGGFFITSALGPGIMELLVGISGGLLVYKAGYLRAKLTYNRQ